MARNQHLTIRVLVGLLLLGSASQAQADGWFYNPFSASTAKTSQPAKKEPSALQKMNQGTKKFFSGMNPFGGSKSKSGSSGSLFSSRKTAKPKKRTTSWNWWFSDPEEEAPQTVDDFMALERPRF